jgi:pro-apoptotic serine protease NMA111
MNTMYITHLNGIATPGQSPEILLIADLSAFLNVALTIPDNTYVRVKVVSFDNQPLVLAIKTNHHYFPTLEMVKDPSSEGGWRRGMEREENGPAHHGVHLGVPDEFDSVEVD